MHENPVNHKVDNSIAAIWSMMLPGLGQLMKGRLCQASSGPWPWDLDILLFSGQVLFCTLPVSSMPLFTKVKTPGLKTHFLRD